MSHTFEPKDAIEVVTPHGLGIVLYITVYGAHQNDLWAVANKETGAILHYQTTQLKLAESGVLQMNEKPKPKLGPEPQALPGKPKDFLLNRAPFVQEMGKR